MVFKVAKGCGKTGALVEGVFVDSEHDGALEAEALLGFALGELMVEALNGGASDVEGVLGSPPSCSITTHSNRPHVETLVLPVRTSRTTFCESIRDNDHVHRVQDSFVIFIFFPGG